MRTGCRLLTFCCVLALLTTGCVPFAPNTPSDLPPADDPNNESPQDAALSNRPPVADAGENRTVRPGGAVRLSALGSRDPDRDSLSFAWFQSDGPPATVDTSAFGSILRITVPEVDEATVLEFTVVVGDGFSSDSDTVRITIDPE